MEYLPIPGLSKYEATTGGMVRRISDQTIIPATKGVYTFIDDEMNTVTKTKDEVIALVGGTVESKPAVAEKVNLADQLAETDTAGAKAPEKTAKAKVKAIRPLATGKASVAGAKAKEATAKPKKAAKKSAKKPAKKTAVKKPAKPAKDIKEWTDEAKAVLKEKTSKSDRAQRLYKMGYTIRQIADKLTDGNAGQVYNAAVLYPRLAKEKKAKEKAKAKK